MPQNRKYDVVVIGGGPAGASAGYLLRKKGYNVLILDKKEFPREKLCGGCLSNKTIQFLKRNYGETEQSLLEKNILNFQAEEYQIYLNNEELSQGKLPLPFYFVKREIYDRYLLDRAREAGVEILEGEEAVEIDPSQHFVKTRSGETIFSKHIVGADGVHSIVRKYFPGTHYNKEKWEENLAIALELKVEYNRLTGCSGEYDPSGARRKFTKPMLFLGAARWGYGWIFPNKENVVIGICSLNKKSHKQIRDKFHCFLKELGLECLIDGTSPSGYPLPYGNFLEHPAYNNLFLIGDAGGFADPIFGEGIFYAHRTAELAAYAIDANLARGENADVIYQDLVQKHVIPEMKHAKTVRTIVYSCLDLGLDRIISFFISIFGERLVDIVHGRRLLNPFKTEESYYGEIKQ